MGAPGGNVADLEAFIEKLSKAQKAVEANAEALGTHSEDLDQLEDRVGGEIGALSDQIEDFQAQVETGTDDTSQEVGKVEQAAHAIAEERFSAAKDDLEAAASDLEERLKTDRDDLDQDATALNETGFRAMAETIDGIQSDLETAGQENDTAFDAFESAADKLGGELDDHFGEAESKLESAKDDLGSQETALESAATSSMHEAYDATSELQGQCATLQGELDQVYDDAEQKIQSEGDDLINSVRGLFDDTAQFVTQWTTDQVEPAATTVLSESVPALNSGLDDLETTLEAASDTAREASALAVDLSIAQSVVDTVRQMLQEMGG